MTDTNNSLPMYLEDIAAYPTLSDPTKQLLWVDFLNKSCTDVGATVPATTGDAIYTVKLPSGWDVLSPGGLVSQATAAKRPTYQTAGAQPNGSTTWMALPTTMTLAGDFTMYLVGSRSANTDGWFPLVDDASNDFTGDFIDGNYYFAFSRSADNVADAVIASSIKRVRRSGNLIYFKNFGQVEQAGTIFTPFVTTSVISNASNNRVSNTNTSFSQIVVVSADISGTANENLVVNSILAKVPTAVGP